MPLFMFINVLDETTFKKAIADITDSDIMVVDTETNGLKYYRKNYIISISIYLPDKNAGYNFPFRHGQGHLVEWDKDTFKTLSWQKKEKKELFLSYWYHHFINDNPDYYDNLPIHYMEQLKSVWAIPDTHIYHNARFDLHMLNAEGFPEPKYIVDTMLQAHIILEDWRGAEFDAPYLNGVRDEGIKDTWARDNNGKLRTKKQPGNRRLKWQGAYLQSVGQISTEYDATIGEDKLIIAINAFKNTLGNYMIEHLDDATLDSLRYKSKNDKQKDRLIKKLLIDNKSQMWMLDSQDVYYYAILDVWLTWQLYLWQCYQIKKWDNTTLQETLNDMQLHVAWKMEVHGFVLDKDRAIAERELLAPRVVDIQNIFNTVCSDNNIEPCSVASSKFLPDVLSKLLPVQLSADIYPEWWQHEKPVKTYDKVLHKVDKASMDKVDEHPLVRMILEYRRMKKTADTYLSSWLSAATDENIVHPNMNLDGTVSGRLSSSGDAGNLQNVPDRNGYTVKQSIVVPDKNWIFFAIDYGQLEARLAAWIAETLLREEGVHSLPPVMTDLFNNKYDIEQLRIINPDIDESKFLKADNSVDMHSFTRELFNIRYQVFEDMTDDEILISRGYMIEGMTEDEKHKIVSHSICRYIAKTMNFGLLYSGTKYMLSKLLKLSLEKSEILVEQWKNYFKAFAVAQEHYQDLSLTRRLIPDESHYAQYVTQPITGRHRRITRYPTYKRFKKDGYWQTFNPQESAAKKTWNNIVQGLGGYMTPYALLQFYRENSYEYLKPFAIIHDAIDGYVHKDHLYLIDNLVSHMVNFPVNPVLTTDVEFSNTTWQDLQSKESIIKKYGSIESWV